MGTIEELFGKSANLVQIGDIERLMKKPQEECHALEYKGAGHLMTDCAKRSLSSTG